MRLEPKQSIYFIFEPKQSIYFIWLFSTSWLHFRDKILEDRHRKEQQKKVLHTEKYEIHRSKHNHNLVVEISMKIGSLTSHSHICDNKQNRLYKLVTHTAFFIPDHTKTEISPMMQILNPPLLGRRNRNT